jgi:hypothetical protein
MRKAVIIVFLAVTAATAWAGTEYRDACRQIIYAVNPVNEIAGVNNDRLRTLGRYALGIAVEGQDQLNENDALLFAFLSRVEMRRRQATANEFSLFLQDEREKLQPYIQGRGDVSIYVKMDGWIDMYQLRIITG